MPGVTISAAYGAGGSVVAARVAQLLEFRCLTGRSARRSQNSCRSRLKRPVTVGSPLGCPTGSSACWLRSRSACWPRAAVRPRVISPHQAMRQPGSASRPKPSCGRALTSGAVILGRAAAAGFQGEPDVLRVRLFGSREARAAQAARIENVDEPTARRGSLR